MISESELEQSLNYLFDSVDTLAQAKAELNSLDQGLKSIKARAFSRASGTVADRENTALVDPDYLQALEAIRAATVRYESARLLREAHLTKVEVWRTFQANARTFERSIR